MSMFSSICTFFLSTSAWSWANGSPYLQEQKRVSSFDLCLYIGLYGFFVSIFLFIWEYIRGDIRQRGVIPVRSMIYFCVSIPLFLTLPTVLGGLLWLNTTILSSLAWFKGETYSRKKKRSYGQEEPMTPKERIIHFFSFSRIKDSINSRCIEIRQRSEFKKYLFVTVYVLFNVIWILYWAAFYSELVIDINDAASRGEGFGDPNNGGYTSDDLATINRDNVSLEDSLNEYRI